MLYIILATLVFAGVLISFILNEISNDEYAKENSIYLTSSALVVEKAYDLEELNIPLDRIESIDLLYSLPVVVKRTRGITYKGIMKGHYTLNGGVQCFMNINSVDAPPFICIYRYGEPLIFNFKDSNHTLIFFNDLLTAWEEIKIDN